jgi:type I restriction enzyme S subunit
LQKIRFNDHKGKKYPDWKERKLSEVLFEHKSKSTGAEEVFSVSVRKGLVNQIEHLGRSYSAAKTDHYNLVKPHDIVYTKSPTGDFPFGIIKQSLVSKNVIVSPLYGIFSPESPGLGYMLNVYFESARNTLNYLSSIVRKGAKNTINITNNTFLSKSLNLPITIEEQNKIGELFKELDIQVNNIESKISKAEQWKKGLMQKMFI